MKQPVSKRLNTHSDAPHRVALRDAPRRLVLSAPQKRDAPNVEVDVTVRCLVPGGVYRVRTANGTTADATYRADLTMLLHGRVPLSLEKIVAVAHRGDWVAIGEWSTDAPAWAA